MTTNVTKAVRRREKALKAFQKTHAALSQAEAAILEEREGLLSQIENLQRLVAEADVEYTKTVDVKNKVSEFLA